MSDGGQLAKQRAALRWLAPGRRHDASCQGKGTGAMMLPSARQGRPGRGVQRELDWSLCGRAAGRRAQPAPASWGISRAPGQAGETSRHCHLPRPDLDHRPAFPALLPIAPSLPSQHAPRRSPTSSLDPGPRPPRLHLGLGPGRPARPHPRSVVGGSLSHAPQPSGELAALTAGLSLPPSLPFRRQRGLQGRQGPAQDQPRRRCVSSLRSRCLCEQRAPPPVVGMTRTTDSDLSAGGPQALMCVAFLLASHRACSRRCPGACRLPARESSSG